MSELSPYEDMQRLLADFASKYMHPAWEMQKKGLPHQLPTDKIFANIFYGFTEITGSLDALDVAEKIIGSAPPRVKGLGLDRYLQYVVGAYLQEVYILEQRLTAYGKKISRLYKIPNLPRLVHSIVYEPLVGIINTRGSHVHNERFSDKHIDSVSTLALFRRMNHELGDDLEFEYSVAKKYWKKRVKSNNEVTQKIVEQYCKALRTVMIENDKIKFPAA